MLERMTIRDVAEILGFSESRVWRMVKRGDIKSVNINRMVFIDKQSIINYKEQYNNDDTSKL